MKLHRPVFSAILQALSAIFNENEYTDFTLERAFFKNLKWGSRDRRFFAECIYDIVRHWRGTVEASGIEWDSEWYSEKTQQPEFPEEVFIYAACTWWLKRGYNLPDWIKGDFERLRDKLDLQENLLENHFGSQHSYPEWWLEFQHEFWREDLIAMNQPALVYLRINPLALGEAAAIVKSLRMQEIEVEPVGEFTLVLKERKNVFQTTDYKAGKFEVQDWGSQDIAPFLDPQPGERILDACAGGGGKSLHLAALMKNKGRILSTDVREEKLMELRKRASRGKVDIIETRPIESSKTMKRLQDSFDRVLLDVPCSGSGVIRRSPDTKWKLTKSALSGLIETQSGILKDYANLVKPGGTIVYSTCSLLPQENELQIENFLKNSGESFENLASKTIHPSQRNCDGFFMAKIRRIK